MNTSPGCGAAAGMPGDSMEADTGVADQAPGAAVPTMGAGGGTYNKVAEYCSLAADRLERLGPQRLFTPQEASARTGPFLQTS